MATAKPRLVTFAASHFFEKARWALDWHGIAYDEVGWPPGLHRILAKRRGLKEAKVPIVFDGDDVVQGTVAIVDWADRKDQNQDRTLTPNAERSEASEIENRVGEVIGRSCSLAICRVAAGARSPGQVGTVPWCDGMAATCR